MGDSNQMMGSEFLQWVLKLGIVLDEHQVNQFQKYADFLVKWNETRNLTSITEVDEIYSKHFFDSLALFPLLQNQLPIHRLMDLGTGAGFPGVPLKIVMPELNLTLCDSLRKRVDFLQYVVEELGLSGVTVIHARAEELAIQKVHRETYSHLVSRAVASMPTLLEWVFPFLNVEGHFYAMKGPSAMEEWRLSNHAAKVLSAVLVQDYGYYLPLNMGERMVLDIKKIKQTPRRFPRKPGDATRNPL